MDKLSKADILSFLDRESDLEIYDVINGKFSLI